MPNERKFNQLTLRVTEGGRFAPDLPYDAVGASNYVEKTNWRRDNLDEVKREGWDYFKPNPSFQTAPTYTLAAGVEAKQIAEVRRPNGTTGWVGIAADKIYAFDYATGTWAQIGSGYTTSGIRRWEVVNVAGYGVFNNGVDLPFTWQVGDAAVTPIYELRERGYASVGTITSYNGMLHCGDLLEIDTEDLAGIMNGGLPYGTVTDPTKTQRIGFKIINSNFGDPRDWATTVPAAATAASPTLTLGYPVLSLEIGDEIIVLGAGTSGGNLTTTIANIVGTTLTMATNAATTVASTQVLHSNGLNSVVSAFELEDDGTSVTRLMPLQNRIVAYKTSSIAVGYYTGDINQPMQYDVVYRGKRTPRFHYTLVDVGGQYHLYAGDDHFYRFKLGSLEPETDRVLEMCEGAKFFDIVSGSDQNNIFAADNACTNEVFFFVKYGSSRGILAYDYEHECASWIDAGFTCAAQCHKPTADDTADPAELWFLMGQTDGTITLYGKTNLAVNTRQRYGVNFASTLKWGYVDFGDPDSEKDLVRWFPTPPQPGTTDATTFSLYGADRTNQTTALLESKTITNPATPGVVELFYRRNYFQDQVATSANANVKLSGRTFVYGFVRSRSITRSTT